MSIPTNIVFLFPGQGSQYPGIGKDLFDRHEIVRHTYEEASDVLSYDIQKLSFDDPDNQINLTQYTQPVLLTHSTACRRIFSQLMNNNVTPSAAAGHSLGEYSALVCADSLSFELALRLVKARGELMGKYSEGEMEALMIDIESATTLAEQHYCDLAACNLPNQNVVGGKTEDLNALITAMAEHFPHKKSTRLKTEGAFHTYYMVEAARRFRLVLTQAEFNPPNIQVMSNFTGGKHDVDTDSIKSRLFFQLFNTVLWYRNLQMVGEHGVQLFIEFGGGLGKGKSPAEKRPSLASIVKKTFHSSENAPNYLSVINAQTLEATVAELV